MKIEVATRSGKVSVDATQVTGSAGLLAVHKALDRDDWTITHIPSGLAFVSTIDSRTKARAIGAQIVAAWFHARDLGIDYVAFFRNPSPDTASPEMKAMGRFIRTVRDIGDYQAGINNMIETLTYARMTGRITVLIDKYGHPPV